MRTKADLIVPVLQVQVAAPWSLETCKTVESASSLLAAVHGSGRALRTGAALTGHNARGEAGDENDWVAARLSCLHDLCEVRICLNLHSDRLLWLLVFQP